MFELADVDVALGLDLVAKPVLEGVYLDVPSGAIVHLVGPSGGGKTTLLRLLNRLVSPARGTVLYRGRPLAERDPVTHRREVAFVPQIPLMLPGTVRDNLEMPLRLRGDRRTAAAMEQAAWRLHVLGFEGAFLENEAGRLSVGERQRVSLVRALMTGPRVLMLDETTAALDPTNAAAMLAFLARLVREDGLTLIHVSHRLEHVRELGGTLVLLHDGRVREVGPVPDVLDAPRTTALAAYLRMVPPPGAAPAAPEPIREIEPPAVVRDASAAPGPRRKASGAPEARL